MNRGANHPKPDATAYAESEALWSDIAQALLSAADMDAYLEARSGDEVIADINHLINRRVTLALAHPEGLR